MINRRGWLTSRLS